MNANVRRMTPRESAQDQARRWIVRIDAGELDAMSRAELRAWLEEDPGHASLLGTHAMLWNTASRAAFPLSTLPQRSAARGWFARSYLLSGSLLGIALVAVAIDYLSASWPASGKQVQAPLNISTAVGQQRQVTLEDGSQVHLNTASVARVAYGGQERRVLLDRGEGLFDVAKDPSRPFEVVAGASVVRAVGTRFLVRRLDERRVEVTVFEGLVEVLRPAPARDATEATRVLRQPLRLAAGQQALDAGDQIVLKTLGPAALNQRLAWQEGRIVFNATPLQDAVEQVNRYAERPLRLADPALQSIKVSGAFSTQDIPVFLLSLEQGFGLRVERGADAVLISAAPRR